ncbi:MAG: RelA/SpoT family protein [Bacteroidales bacterium]|nr:RelA/SpoT family protein [Bacteroidales bacterium]
MQIIPADPEIEKKEIVRKYRNLLRVSTIREPADKKLIRRAFNLAADAHKDMRRHSGEPYIYHPLEVATIVAGEIGMGATSIISALLHDVVEDTNYTLDDIRFHFGEKVARIIDGLTKIEDMIDKPSVSPQAENFRKIILTISQDVRVIIIKLADRLHNMRTLEALPQHKQLKISSETIFLYAPLAHRLGLFSIKSELEDLFLKANEPEIYRSLQQKLKDTQTERNKFTGKFIYPIKRDMRLKEMKFQIFTREKSVFSIWQKMKNKEIPFEEVYDLFAVRIVIDVLMELEKSECWKVYSIITDHYRPNHNRLRDWISIPKANGYEALHTTVMSHTGKWVEVQIRSRRMDEIAERGYAAHWKYKDTIDTETGLEEWLTKVRDMLQEEEDDALDFVSEFKMNLFADEIYAYTPHGDVKTLPAGSTVLDFAYAIHTEVGNHCIGAKVNQVLVSRKHTLKNGDQVEVLNSDSIFPDEEWLKVAVTPRARVKIKQFVKDQHRKIILQGKEKLSGLFSECNLTDDKTTLQKFIGFHQISSFEDLYRMVTNSDIGLEDVKRFTQEGEKRNIFTYLSRPFIKTRPVNNMSLAETIVEKLKEKPESLLLSDDIAHIKYIVARCCSPIPGDDVVGFMNENDSIEIHRTNCPDAIDLMSKYGKRIIKAKWKNKESVGFLTGIRIQGVDKKGFIRKVTEVITEKHNINIRSFHLDTSEGMTKGTIMLYVHDTQTLQKLITNLLSIKDIIKVTRLDRFED